MNAPRSRPLSTPLLSLLRRPGAAADGAAARAPAGQGASDWSDRAALALLAQAGVEPPEGGGDVAYLQGLVDRLVELSSTDPLSGLANRRLFELQLAREADRVARTGEPAVLLLVDIDHFKKVNDSHGHAAGDDAICAIAQALDRGVRPMDLVARVGGEEFAVLLPNCPPTFAAQVAQRIRLQVARVRVRLADGGSFGVTVSVGGAHAAPWQRNATADWLARADRQLYRAKSEGRDRACIEDVPALEVGADERALLLNATGAVPHGDPDDPR